MALMKKIANFASNQYYNDMKKLFFVAIALVCMLSSCEKTDKCKCTIELNSSVLDATLKDQIISRPADVNCSDIKIEDIEGEIISIDLSKVGKIKCVNYSE